MTVFWESQPFQEAQAFAGMTMLGVGRSVSTDSFAASTSGVSKFAGSR
jgi:hypothetical protein